MKYRIIDGSEKMNLDEVVKLLKMTYWADKRSVEQIRKSMDNSSCYGVYLDDEKKLAGFARVISGYATTYYLCDVIIDTSYQHMGLGTALVSYGCKYFFRVVLKLNHYPKNHTVCPGLLQLFSRYGIHNEFSSTAYFSR